jgi:hypothetical protein
MFLPLPAVEFFVELHNAKCQLTALTRRQSSHNGFGASNGMSETADRLERIGHLLTSAGNSIPCVSQKCVQYRESLARVVRVSK